MDESNTKTLRVLVIQHAQPGVPETLTWLADHGSVTAVGSAEDALQLMQDQEFDLIVGGPADFHLPEPVALSPQATAILESVTQGLCIVEQGGHLVWANPRMLSFSDEIKDHACRLCAEMFSWATSESTRKPAHLRGRRFSFTTPNQEHIEITATPVIDLNNRVTQVAAVVWDATKARRMQEQIDAIDNAGRELVRLDAEQISRLNAHERLDLLEQKIIRYTHELMHFDNFAVAVLDKKTSKLEFVLSAGLPNEVQQIDIYASSEGNGICGYVAHTGRSYICPEGPALPAGDCARPLLADRTAPHARSRDRGIQHRERTAGGFHRRRPAVSRDLRPARCRRPAHARSAGDRAPYRNGATRGGRHGRDHRSAE